MPRVGERVALFVRSWLNIVVNGSGTPDFLVVSFKVVPVVTGTPRFGSAAGTITMRDDFDAPLDECEALMRCRCGD